MPLKVKARYLLLAFLPYLIFYFLIQSLIGTSRYNLLMGIDEKIPFIPPFIWVYHTIIPVVILTAIFLFQNRDIFLGLIFSFIFSGIVMCLFYIFFPSFYPRELFVEVSTVSGWLIEVTRSIDGPHNTFPSGHVTFAWLLMFFVSLSQYTRKHSWIKVLYFCWAALVSISTLTLKQHFIVDVFSGIILAALSYYLSRKLFVVRHNEKLITNRCTTPFPKKLSNPNV